MILKAEKIVDGVATPLALNYTVESNILSKNMLNLNKYFLTIGNNPNCKGRLTGSSLTTNSQQVNNICGRFTSPFYYGSLILTEESKLMNDNPVLQLYTQKDYLVGVADCFKTYSGSSSINGTANKKETYFNCDNPNDLHFHLVYDFPTHSANNREIKEVCFLPRPYIDTNGTDSTVGGQKYLDSGLSTWIYEPLVYFPQSSGFASNGTKFEINNDDNIITIKDAKTLYINYNGLIGPAEFADSDLAAVATKNVFVKNNKFYFTGGLDISIGSSTSQMNYWEVSEIYFDETKKINVIKTVKKTMPYELNPFGSSYSYPQKIFEWDGFMYMVMGYLTRMKVVKYNMELTEIVKTMSEPVSGVKLESSSNTYNMSVIHLPDTHKCVVSQGGVGTSTSARPFIFDKELNWEITNYNALGSYSKNSCQFYCKLPNLNKGYGISEAHNPLAHTSSSTDFVIGYAEIMDRDILRFKLGTPLVKKADETLKLTFDIHLKNGDIYTE